MPLNGIIWIIMQQPKRLSTFTLGAFVTVINLIYKSLFDHQPFIGLSTILNSIKLFAKKEYKFE